MCIERSALAVPVALAPMTMCMSQTKKQKAQAAGARAQQGPAPAPLVSSGVWLQMVLCFFSSSTHGSTYDLRIEE